MTTRQVLMIELDGCDAEVAAARIEATIPDARVWGAVDPMQAALLVIDRTFPVAA